MRKLYLIIAISLLNVGCASTGNYFNEMDDRLKWSFTCDASDDDYEYFLEHRKCAHNKGFNPITGWYYKEKCNIDKHNHKIIKGSTSSLTEEEKLEMDCYLVTGNPCWMLE